MNEPKTKIIRQDGKIYEFTPGKHGSTIERVTRERKEEPLFPPIEKRAKVIPATPPAVGATRG